MVTIIIITTVAATTIPTTFTITIIITITTDNIEVVITTWTGTILSVLQDETHLILIMTLWGKYHFMMRRLGHRELTDLGPRAHRGRTEIQIQAISLPLQHSVLQHLLVYCQWWETLFWVSPFAFQSPTLAQDFLHVEREICPPVFFPWLSAQHHLLLQYLIWFDNKST